MKIQKQAPFEVLNKSYSRLPMSFAQMDNFKAGLALMFGRINEQESEENLKNIVADFLKNTFYSPDYEVNTKGRNDLVIHEGRTSTDPVGVIIEAKKPSNRSEMISFEKPNSKALHELVLYYLREKMEANNHKIKYLIATDIWQWYFFDENWFEKNIFLNTQLRKDYQEWKISGKDTAHFYKNIAQTFLEKFEEIPCCVVNLLDYRDLVVREDTNNGGVSEEETQPDRPLVLLYKLFSPEHLLKKPFANDANSLNTEFYFELLHILGLKEKMETGVLKIKRKEAKERQEGSWLENTIRKIESTKRHETLPNLVEFGESLDDQLFSIGLELTITWLNRVLFLKLLEGQLIRYHRKDRKYAFLNIETLADFDELEELFFEVLAVPTEKRSPIVKQKFGHLPYLNSALFEITDLEQKLLTIGCLKDRLQLPLYQTTVLKDEKGKMRKGDKSTLVYLFEFLDSFDFGSNSNDLLQEKPKAIINAYVLGNIFEKLNGYADGSFFTPPFITEYMCRETIQKAVIQKFKERKQDFPKFKHLDLIDNIEDLADLFHIADREARKKANEVINSVRICDPSVGSGHFLVAVLNELLEIKFKMKVLQYVDGNRMVDVEFSIINEEINVLALETGEELNYEVPTALAIKNLKVKSQKQLLQETLFYEKKTLIENCLFGVDINPKSVMICRLRLWIELLKNAYYTQESQYQELQTLPNIDINIKIGNSLVSRFDVDTDLSQVFNKAKYSVQSYLLAVESYKETTNSQAKDELRRFLKEIKEQFKVLVLNNDLRLKRINLLKGQVQLIENKAVIGDLFKKLTEDDIVLDKAKVEKEIEALEKEYKEFTEGKLFRNAFEWRFEFPEILDEKGNFVGFDAIVGNPPYIRQEMFKALKPYLEHNYEVFDSISDMLTYFIELSYNLLKTNAHFSMVVSNKFARANYGKKLRQFISEKTEIHNFIDFNGVKVFDSATVDVVIVGFAKKEAEKDHQFTYCSIEADLFKQQKQNTIDYIPQFAKKILQNELSAESWAFESTKVKQIKAKVTEQGTPLMEWKLSINLGIKTGFNEAFVIDSDTKNQLIAKGAENANLIKPLIRGRDIQPYYADYQDLWLIGTFPSLKLEIDNYPIIKQHLLSFGQERLEQSGNVGSRKKTGNKWFETQDNIAYWEDFEKPKIMYRDITQNFEFVYDESGFYTNNTVFIMTGEHLKYLVAVFNSKLFRYCFADNFSELGTEGRRMFKVFFEKISIKKPSESEEKPFVELVDRILGLQKTVVREDSDNGKRNLEKVAELQAQINALVYEIYGLTAEEIAEIEK